MFSDDYVMVSLGYLKKKDGWSKLVFCFILVGHCFDVTQGYMGYLENKT